MFSRYMVRTTLGIVLCLAIVSPGFGQVQSLPCGNSTGPVAGCGKSSTGAVVLIVSALAAGATILYVMHHRKHNAQAPSQSSIVGCLQKTDEGMFLKNENDNQTYAIISDAVDLRVGKRVELTGTKFKDRQGKLNMDVQTLVMDYGACSP